MSSFEENEISKNAFGGTEIAKRKLATIIDPDLLSNFQIVCSRPRELQMDKIRVFWAHDLAEDPESNKFKEQSFQNSFHKFVFISNWQMQRYQLFHNIPFDTKSVVLESGIEPAPLSCLTKPKGETIRIVYTSTPQRGLEILVPVFEKLCEFYDDIHLDVFSSFKIYGWDEMDKQFEFLYDRIRNHPKMTYYGFVPNEQLKEHLNKSHIFAYPSIWTETSCRAMLEAMSAGLICVHSNLGALPETSGGLNVMYQADMVDRNHHASILIDRLNGVLNLVRTQDYSQMISLNKAFVDTRFNIDRIKDQWEIMMKDMLHKFPTVESRSKPKQTFVYRTS